MKKRKMINYEDIVEIGLSLIKGETDVIYGESEKNKAESAIRICGIVDFLKALDEATVLSESDICENPDTSISKQVELNTDKTLSDIIDEILKKALPTVIAMSDEDWVNYLNSGLKGN